MEECESSGFKEHGYDYDHANFSMCCIAAQSLVLGRLGMQNFLQKLSLEKDWKEKVSSNATIIGSISGGMDQFTACFSKRPVQIDKFDAKIHPKRCHKKSIKNRPKSIQGQLK